MKKICVFFISVLLIIPTIIYAATSADYLNGFEGGTNGNTLTATTLTNSQNGSGGTHAISKTPMTGYTYSTSGQLSSSRGFTINGVNYDLTGDIGYAADMSQTAANHGFMRYNFPAAVDNVALGFMWKPGNVATYDPYGSYTLACIYSSGGYYQCLNINSWADAPYGVMKAYIEGAGLGDPVEYTPGTTYWVTINWVRNGTSTLGLYNSTTFALIGTSTFATPNVQASMIFIGRPDAHNGEASVNMYYDNVALKYSSTDALLPSTLEPPQTVFYVDKDSIGGACDDSNAGSITAPWCTIGKANTSLIAGNTCHIRGGTYAGYINPSNSGETGNPITYTAYTGETVTISGQDYAVLINDKDYIIVNGINATGCIRNLHIVSGANNEISNCSFLNPTNTNWDVSIIYSGSQYNWIHDNTFGRGGCCGVDGTCAGTAGEDYGSVLNIGVWTNASESTNYNLIENNVLYHGGHNVMGVYSRFNTIRNNYIHNEAFSNSCGNRNMEVAGETDVSGWNLFEGNRLGYPAKPCDDAITANIGVSSPNNIFRYNYFYHSNANHIGFTAYTGYESGSNNKIYNNTFYNAAYNIDAGYVNSAADSVLWWMSASASGNIVINNLFSEYYQVSGGSPVSVQTIGTNWSADTQGDPLFVSASTTPPSDKTVSTTPNLSIQTGSPCIDSGVHLTTVHADDSGSGTTLILTNASFFQDGTWSPSGKISADQIAVGTVSNVATISSINYATNTITLSSGISRSDGDYVWLVKNSSGTTVLINTAPDFGAFEFTADDEPPTQYSLTVTKAGNGNGEVTSSPSGISCGAACTYDYDESTEVTLTATPTGANVFAGWSGTGGCTGTSTCVLTMSAAKAATATFNLPTIPVRFSGGGFSGTIQ